MVMYGADPDLLDQTAASVDEFSRRINSIQGELNSRLYAAPWKGQKADQFRNAWSSRYRRDLVSAAAFMHDAAETLRRNANEQRRASEDDHRGSRVHGTSGARGSLPGWLRRIGGSLHGIEGLLRRAPWIAGLVTASGLPGLAKNLGRTGSSFATAFREAGWFGDFSTPFNTATKDLLGNSKWLNEDSQLLTRLAGKFPRAESALKWAKGGGKVLGGAGIILDGLSAYDAFTHGRIGDGIASSVSAVGGGLMMLPPPAGVVGGVLVAGALIYQYRDSIGNAGRAAGEAIGHAGAAVANGMAKAASSIGKSVGGALKRLNPFG